MRLHVEVDDVRDAAQAADQVHGVAGVTDTNYVPSRKTCACTVRVWKRTMSRECDVAQRIKWRGRDLQARGINQEQELAVRQFDRQSLRSILRLRTWRCW